MWFGYHDHFHWLRDVDSSIPYSQAGRPDAAGWLMYFGNADVCHLTVGADLVSWNTGFPPGPVYTDYWPTIDGPTNPAEQHLRPLDQMRIWGGRKVLPVVVCPHQNFTDSQWTWFLVNLMYHIVYIKQVVPVGLEIWNEPNRDPFNDEVPPKPNPTGGITAQRIAHLANLAKTGLDYWLPGVQIVAGGVLAREGSGVDPLRKHTKYIADLHAALNPGIDISFHPYVTNYARDQLDAWGPSGVVPGIISDIRRLFNEAKTAAPGRGIWITEFGFPSGCSSWWDEFRQAVHLADLYTWFKQAPQNAKAGLVYRLTHGEVCGENRFGEMSVLHAGDIPKLSYQYMGIIPH